MRAFIFDLDGTLVDTVYAHVLARIGMSGGLSVRALAREIGRSLAAAEQDRLQRRHGEIYRVLLPERRPLPGALELVSWSRENGAGRAGMLSVGLLSGGYGVDELVQAGAFRVYRDPQELLDSLDELGIPLPGGEPP